jgi:HEPN domain-containing protein
VDALLFSDPETALIGADEDELARIVRIIFDEFERAVYGGTSSWKRTGRILKLIQFSSCRNDAEDEAGDRQLLVVVNKEELTDPVQYWSGAEDRLAREHAIMGRLSRPVRLTVCSLTFVNRQIEAGRPFFVRLAGEGRRLFEAEGFFLAAPSRLPGEAALEEAYTAFQTWFASAERRLEIVEFEERKAAEDGTWRKDAAFTLHQAVERLYTCMLLTYGGYAPRTHRIDLLRSLAETMEPRLGAAWPRERRCERRCFALLQQGYVGSRYWSHYRIGAPELVWLSDHTRLLRDLVGQACCERLTMLGEPSSWGRATAE